MRRLAQGIMGDVTLLFVSAGVVRHLDRLGGQGLAVVASAAPGIAAAQNFRAVARLSGGAPLVSDA